MRLKLSRESTDAYPENLGSTTVLGTVQQMSQRLQLCVGTVNQLVSNRLTENGQKQRCRTAPGGCPVDLAEALEENWIETMGQNPSIVLPERRTLPPCAATQETCLKTNRCFKRASAGDLIITLLLSSMPQDTEIKWQVRAHFEESWTR